VVMNRTVPEPLVGRLRRRANVIPPEIRRKLRDARRELEALADRDRRMAANLRAAAYGVPIAMVPAFARDVASLESLRDIAEVFAPGLSRRGKVVPLRGGAGEPG
jgi:hypothetical protein